MNELSPAPTITCGGRFCFGASLTVNPTFAGMAQICKSGMGGTGTSLPMG